MLRGGIRTIVLATLAVAGLSSCGNPAPVHTQTGTASATAAPRPSAAAGPCASVTTTTPIGQVPAACAALWTPYGVTKVPPANLTDATPAPPAVVNGTQGGLTGTELAFWVRASTRASVWYRWAEANDQAALIPHLGQLSLVPKVELQAMAANEPISQPDCALFPTKVEAFTITRDELHFFVTEGEIVAARYAFVGTYPGPCLVTAEGPTGKPITLASYPSASVTFFASSMVNDALLGPILFTDGAGNCTDPGAPTRWCRS